MRVFRCLTVPFCTIRDGGYINNWDFSPRMVRDVYQRLSRAGVDFVEIGFRDAEPAGTPLWRQCPEEELSKIKKGIQGAKICVMVDFGKAGPEDFMPAKDSAIDMVRIAVHKDKVIRALDLALKIKAKGYMVSIQLMGYPQYNTPERDELFRRLKDSLLDYVYVADSYGSLLPDQVRALVEPLVAIESFKVGFHPHNNLQLAFANALEAIKAGANIIDCTLYGMGRGAGNLATETLLTYLQQKAVDKYNVNAALYCVDMYFLKIRKQYEWGYQLPFMLSGACQCHPFYAKELVETRRYDIEDIWKALRVIKGYNPVGFDRSLLKQVMDSGMFEYGQLPEEEISRDGMKGMEGKGKVTSECETPTYLNRYKDTPFLVLANGPNLRKCAEDISRFVEKYNPVILGANYLEGTIMPHYHAFVNKKRFIQYVHTVDYRSKLLLSHYLPDEFIKEYTDRSFERICFLRGNRNKLFIKDGVISSDCSSTSMLLIAVAAVMGASEIFVAGMDGYLIPDENNSYYFYPEEDATSSPEFNMLRHRWGERTLELLDDYLIKSGRSGVNIITPTSYDRYYRGINSLIEPESDR